MMVNNNKKYFKNIDVVINFANVSGLLMSAISVLLYGGGLERYNELQLITSLPSFYGGHRSTFTDDRYK